MVNVRRAGDRFPREREIIIADTVGFIRDLPPDLAQAFRATLEELNEADLFLHLVDASDAGWEAQRTAVERILAERGLAETPRILVMNKVDRLDPTERARLASQRSAPGDVPVVAIAAVDRESTKPLLDLVERTLWREGRYVPPADAHPA